MSPAGISLREGGLADLPGVMAVMDESFEPRFGEAWTAAQCAGLLPLPGVWLSVAHDRGAIVGFSLSRLVADEAELLLLAVRESAQGRGIGKALLVRFSELAQAHGATRLHLEVREGNHAIKLYDAAGFACVGRRANYYSSPDGNSHHALTLSKYVGDANENRHLK